MRAPRRVAFALVGLLVLAVPRRGAGEAGQGPWWPRFHGPNQDNISPDTGLLKAWPADGPPLAWKFSECGKGYAGVAIADGLLYTTGDFDDAECVLALDLDGKLVWKAENGKAWKGAMPGSRTTPTYDDGRLFHLNPAGRIAAFDAKSGKPLWAVDLKREFDAQFGLWGLCENLAVDGPRVFCSPGGTKGRFVALDKKTGKTLWANTEFGESAAFCSPIVVTHHGTRQLITMMRSQIVGVNAETGALLWTHPHTAAYCQNVTMPIYHEGLVAASSGHSTGTRVVRLAPDSKSVTEVWAGKELDNCHGGLALLGGHLYGHGCRLYNRGFSCVDFATGKLVWTEKALNKFSFTVADGLLYGTNERARVFLVDAQPAGCRIVSQFTLPKKATEETLGHPVVCGGRLYLRHWDEMFAYDVRAAK